jgi:hypothetical protein
MDETPGAMRLRTLQTIDGLGAGPVNTVIIFPAELTDVVQTLAEILAPRRNGAPAAAPQPALPSAPGRGTS